MNEIVRASVNSNINEINDERNVELFPEIWNGGSDAVILGMYWRCQKWSFFRSLVNLVI